MKNDRTQPINVSLAALYKFTPLVFFAIAIYTMSISAAHAFTSTFGQYLCNGVIIVSGGNLGKGLATIGILSLGVGATLGKVSWGMAVLLGVGISVVFGALIIVNALTGYECIIPA